MAGDEELNSDEEPNGPTKASGKKKQPGTKGLEIRELLLSGYSEEDVVALGYNPTSVRIYALELEKEGLRQRPQGKKVIVPSKAVSFSRPVPPEALIAGLEMPDESGSGGVFEAGMKFGMGCILLGIRLAQEVSAMGVQQAKPLIEMAKDMRAGEAQVARAAAFEAAGEVVHEVGGMMTVLEKQIQSVSASPIPPDNPFAPMFSVMGKHAAGLMEKTLGGLLGGGQQPALPQPQPQVQEEPRDSQISIPGWVRVQRKGLEEAPTDDARGPAEGSSIEGTDEEHQG